MKNQNSNCEEMLTLNSNRLKNTIINSSILTLIQIITILLKFITQTIFIHFLGKTFLGLNGLFTNVLSVLSFAELGVGTSIVFSLYKPLAENDERKVAALMNFFRHSYIAIGIVIAILGVAIIPFMPFLIKDYSKLSYVDYYFVVYLLNSVVSYFFTYKRSLLIADQKEYVSAINQFFYMLLQVFLQSAALLLLHSYSIYLWIAVFCTILSNITISHRVNIRYPYLKKNEKLVIDEDTKKKIGYNVAGMVGSKVGSIVVRSTDNLLLSAFMGIGIVGLYSNYLLIITSVGSVLTKLINSATASIGNLVVEGKNRHSLNVFLNHFMLNMYVVTIIFGCILSAVNPFIRFWAGSNYVLTQFTVYVVILNFFIDQLRQSSLTFISAYGLFVENGRKSVIEAIMNLILSLILLVVFHLGIVGVLSGTILTNLLLNSWWEPLLLFRKGFGYRKFFLAFYVRYYLLNMIAMVLSIFAFNKLIMYVDTFVNVGNLLLAVFNAIVMGVLLILWIIIVYHSTRSYKYLKKIGFRILKKSI